MQLEFFASMHVYEINVQYVRTSNFYSVITLNKEKNAPRIEYRSPYQLDNIPSGLFLLPRSPTRCSRQALYKCTPLLSFLYKQPLDSWTTKYRDLLIPRGLSRALTVKLPSVYSLWYTPLALAEEIIAWRSIPSEVLSPRSVDLMFLIMQSAVNNLAKRLLNGVV